jgi:hypothetical protein
MFYEAWERFLQPINLMLSLPAIFRIKAGGLALAKFIKMTHACIKPRKQPVEDHG